MPHDESSLLKEITQIFRKSIRKIHKNVRQNGPEGKDIYMLSQMTTALTKIRKELKSNQSLSKVSKSKLNTLLAQVYENETKKGSGPRKRLRISSSPIKEDEAVREYGEKVGEEGKSDVLRETVIEEESMAQNRPSESIESVSEGEKAEETVSKPSSFDITPC